MKKYLWIFIILLLLSIESYSQNKTSGNIQGQVTNLKTKEIVPYINVSIKGTTIGTLSDAKGHYRLNDVPVGNQTIVVSGISYKTTEQNIEVKANTTIEVNLETENDEIMLESLVVSANKNVTKRNQAPVIVNIISPKIFEKTNSVCLAQGLNFQPGLRVETNCQNCGTKQVRINGLSGPYSQILINSRPIFSALESVYGIEEIPTNMIKRVEVVRGGGSAIFGSNAIGGTINIITKDPNSNSVEISNTSTLIGGKTPDINTNFNASVVSDNNKLGIIIFGSTRQRSPFDYNGDGFSEIPMFNDKNIGFRSFLKTNNYSKLTIEYHNLSDFRRGGNDFDLPPHEADIDEQAKYNINTGSINYNIFTKNEKHHFDFYTSTQQINRDNYAGAQQDMNAYGKTMGKTLVSGMQYTYSMDKLIFMPAEFTFGSEYNIDKLHDEILGYNKITNQTVITKSAFVQNEWKNRKLSILIGGRIDKNNHIDNPIVSPRLNFRYKITNNISLRTSYATGFRAPQVYDEDLHGSAIGGEIAFIHNTPNLKTEKSQSLSGSIDLEKVFGNTQTEFLIEGFYTNLDNVFFLQDMGTDINGNMIFERKNGSGALVQGINLEGKIFPTNNIQLQFGMTIQKSEYAENHQWSDDQSILPQKKMFRSPNRYGYLTAYYDITKKLETSITGTYTGSMLVQHFAGYISKDVETMTPDFYNLNFKISYDFKLTGNAKAQINGGVQNILNSYQNDFDKGGFRDAGYIYGPAMPRSFFLGAKISI